MDYVSCLSATELRTITAKRDDLHSKYIHILNPTVREDIVHPLTAVTNCQICVRLKKAAERTKSRGCLFKVVDTRGPANFGIVTFDTYSICMSSVAAFVYSFFQH